MTITEPTTAALDVRHLNVADIDPDPDNRTITLDKAFVSSIEAEGVLTPITVIAHPTDAERFQVVFGHRRLAASKKVGHSTIPASVRTDLDDMGIVSQQLIENLLREDLTPGQEATQLLRGIGVGHTVKTLAATVGRSQKWVRERLTIAELPADARKRIDNGEWTIADGVAAAKLVDDPESFARLTSLQSWRGVGREVEIILSEQAFQTAAVKLINAAKRKGLTVLDADTQGIHRLDALHISDEDHQGEECHALILQGHPHQGPQLEGVCTNKANHNKRGTSDIKLPAKADTTTAEQRAAKAAERDAKAARAAAIASIATGTLSRGEHVALIEATLLRSVSADIAKRALRMLGVEYDKKHYEPTVLEDWASAKPAHMSQAVRAIALVEHTHRADHGWATDQTKIRRAWQKFIAKHSAWKPAQWDKDQLK